MQNEIMSAVRTVLDAVILDDGPYAYKKNGVWTGIAWDVVKLLEKVSQNDSDFTRWIGSLTKSVMIVQRKPST